MRAHLRALIVEDSENDAALILRAISRTFEVVHRRIDSEQGMAAALAESIWDIIISDYNMPQFSGAAALQVLKKSGQNIPFIYVSGAISEEAAVEAMKSGVDDYVLKDNLARLVPAISRELQRAKVHAGRQEAESERDRYFEGSSEMLWIAGMDGYFQRVNPAFEKIMGRAAQELIAIPMKSFIHHEDQAMAVAQFKNVVNGGTVRDFECRYLSAGGIYNWVSWNGIRSNGRIYGAARDISENRKVAEALLEDAKMQDALAALGQFALQGASLSRVYERAVNISHQFLKADNCGLFNLLLDGKTLQSQFGIGWANKPHSLTFQVSRESHPGYAMLTGLPILFEDLSKETRFIPSVYMQNAEVRSGIAVLVQGISKKFGVLTAHSRRISHFGQKELSFLQTVANVVAAAMERSQFEAHLNISGRMATVGQMAAGIAHEVNNPLSYVIANLEAAIDELEATSATVGNLSAEPLLKIIKEAQEGIERVRVVVSDLTTFSRSAEDRQDSINVENVIDSSVRMMINQIRHRAKLVKNYKATPLVKANEGKLGQVIMNLLINATQSIPEDNLASNTIKVSTYTDKNGKAVIDVTDSGSGIAPDLLGSIFDPFFTTKAIGTGTGLGLSICRSIVMKMEGDLEVESQMGRGSTFRIILPAAENQQASAQPSPGPELKPTSSSRKKILLIDDEKFLLEALKRGLSRTQDVTITTSPLEAISIIKAKGGSFDAIFCDLMMAELTGMDFYDRIKSEQPGMESKIVFMTGGVFTEKARIFLESISNLRLIKPFSLREINSLLHS